MKQPTPPKIATVEVVAAQPSELDRHTLASLSLDRKKGAAEVAYVVKLSLKTKPPVTSQAWMLYVKDVLIPKYWEYEGGIYFTVVDPEFFAEHQGQKLRFSQDGTEFIDTGVKLPAPAAATETAKGKAARLPLQADVLK